MTKADPTIWIISLRVEKNVAGNLKGENLASAVEAGCGLTGGAVFTLTLYKQKGKGY